MVKQKKKSPKKQTAPTVPQWANKIVGSADVPPAKLIAHDKNWRAHPKSQHDALLGAIGEVGFLRSVTVNKRTDRILDGHLRVELALESGQETIPVEYVDLTEEEEAKALLTLDPLSAMASADAAKLDALLREVQTGSEALGAMLTELAAKAGVVSPEVMEGKEFDESVAADVEYCECPSCGHKWPK